MSLTSNFFQISPYFSYRWVDNDVSSPYNTLPLDSQVDDLSYQQPIQCGGGGYQSDTGKIHVLSSFVPTCKLYDYYNTYIKTVTLTPIDPPVLNVDFIYYIGEVTFADVDPGEYYLKITYTDQFDVARDWRTSPLDVQVYHEGTQLIEATNTANDKGVVFVNADGSYNWSTFRVASLIRNPLVKTDAQDYEDQYNDLTQETSIPFVVYTQCIGGVILLPFWVIEKINLLYSLDSVLIDGKPFAKIANAEFKPTRADVQPQGAWWEVDIQPNYSYPAEIYATGNPGPDTFYEIKMQKTYTNVSADFAVIGVLTAMCNLVRIAVNNVGGDLFTLVVALTETPSEDSDYIATFDIPADFDDSLDIGKLFVTPTTIWILGVAGTNCTLILDYNNYLAPPITQTPTSGTAWVKNTIYYFIEVEPGSFAVEFDVSTGLGNTGTDHAGCILIGSPSDGLPNYKELLLRIWNAQEILPVATRQTVIGSNTVSLNPDNIPFHTHNAINGDTTSSGTNDVGVGQSVLRKGTQGGTGAYDLQGNTTQPDRGVTSTQIDPTTGNPITGAQAAIDVTNAALILPAFYYVGT